MKYIILLLLLPFIVSGQDIQYSKDYKTTISSPYEVIDGEKYYESVGNTGVTVKRDGKKVYIQTFDLQTVKEKTRKEYEDLQKGFVLIQLLTMKDKIYLLYEVKEKVIMFYSREIDLKTGSFKSEKLQFSSIREVVTPNTYDFSSNFFFSKKYNVIKSYDESKVVIEYRNKPLLKDDSKNYDELGMFVFDENMTKIWGKDVKMPYTEKQMNNVAYAVNNKGIAYMIARNNETKKYEVFIIQNGQLKTKPMNLKMDNYWDRFEMRENANGNLLVFGYYTQGLEFSMGVGLSSNHNGIYSFELSAEGDVLNAHENEFSLDLIKKFKSEAAQNKIDKKEAKGKAGINNLVMRKIEVLNDGILVIGEVFFITYKYNPNSKTQTAVPHHDELIVTKLSADGKVLWENKVPKRIDDGYFSLGAFSYINNGTSHAFIFPDNKKNAKNTSDKIKNGMGDYLTLFKIDNASGNMEKHVLFDLDDIQGIKTHQFSFRRMFPSNGKAFVMEVYIKNKKDMLVKIE